MPESQICRNIDDGPTFLGISWWCDGEHHRLYYDHEHKVIILADHPTYVVEGEQVVAAMGGPCHCECVCRLFHWIRSNKIVITSAGPCVFDECRVTGSDWFGEHGYEYDPWTGGITRP